MGNTYGYVRVSTREQNESRQLLAFSEQNVPEKNIFIDKQSGKDFDRPMYMRLLSFVAENERKNIRERQKEGIEAARRRGVQFGRPELPLPENFIQIYSQWAEGKIGGPQAAGLCGMPITSFYRKANKHREKQKYHQCADK